MHRVLSSEVNVHFKKQLFSDNLYRDSKHTNRILTPFWQANSNSAREEIP
jgi:hypothetical protein